MADSRPHFEQRHWLFRTGIELVPVLAEKSACQSSLRRMV
jgi:hypothetical protein